MNKRFFRVVIFALFAGAGFASTAHELECEKTAGIVKLDATGHPMLDTATGLPIFAVAPAAVLEVGTYPTAIGFRIGVHNLAGDTSVVTGVSDPLLDALASKATFGTLIGPGLSLAVNGKAEQVMVVTVDSQQQCLDLFKNGATGAAPACQNVVENRFVVSHEAGSAECRGQIICAAPPPPPTCDAGQHKCDGQCVSNSDVNSCGASCTPCAAPPQHAKATCNGVACGFECDVGFVLSNGACISGSAPVPAPTCENTWQGVKQFGTTENDRGWAVALDSLCNLHVVGSTSGAFTSDANGREDVFLASFDRSGTRYQTRQFGSEFNAMGIGVSIDAAGNRYVAWQSSTSRVTKFDAAGNQLWTTVVNSSGDINIGGVVADAAGNSYAVGTTSASATSQTDAFVTKLDTLGNKVWTRLLDSGTNDFARAVALDEHGHVYVVGETIGDLGGTNQGHQDGFLAKLDTITGETIWIRQFGTESAETPSGVGVDANDNAYVTGDVSVFVDHLPSGNFDVFLTKYDKDGNQKWFTQFGSKGSDGSDLFDSAAAVAVDAAGNAWIAGSTAGALNAQTGETDAFVTKFDTAGTRLWTQQFGTTNGEFGQGVVVDAGGVAYVTGATQGDLGGSSAGGYDAFLAKIDANGNLTTPMAGIAGH
jgi:Beta-propeller repeat